MDNTILNVAIPSLVTELGATNSQLQWIVDGYTLVFAGLLLTTGSLGDRFGRKLALRVGIIIFGIGSVMSALAGSASQLIATRALMGLGGALIMPSTLSILTNVFRDPKERGRAIAIWAGFSGLGVALGPVIGGVLLTHFSWSSVFWVNLPIGSIALIAGWFFVPESKDPKATRLDPVGALLSIVGLASLLFGIIEGPTKGWSSAEVTGAFALGVTAISVFIIWERHRTDPMLDMTFFKNPRFTAANTAVTLTFFAMFGSIFLMTQYWQLVHGYTPLQAGIRLIPYALSMMITAPLSARLVERIGTKQVVTLGLSLISVAMLILSTLHTDSSYLRVIANMCLMAVGMGLTMAPATESVMGSLPRAKAGVGSAVNDTTRQVGGAMGVAVIGTLVASSYAGGIDRIAGRFGLTGTRAGREPGRQRTGVRTRREGLVRRRPRPRPASRRRRRGLGRIRRLPVPAGQRPPTRQCRPTPRGGTGAGGRLVNAVVDPPRGRPRNEACTGEIMIAALELVAEVGIAGLTMDGVAARAGVGKATIYRRWSSKEALMLDAWMSCVRAPVVPDTGNLRDDLVAVLTGFDRPLSERDLQRIFPQMIAAAKVNPDVADAYKTFIAGRRRPLATVLQRGVERGDIDPTVDLDVVYDLLVAPMLFRWLVTDASIDEDVTDRLITIVLRGIAPA
jgi:EmrB/QacA subfamily drug resistance transporter